MMHPEMDTGAGARAPLRAAEGGEETAEELAEKSVARKRCKTLLITLWVDIFLGPIMMLAPFRFDIALWWDEEFSNFSFDGSLADWYIFSTVRSVLMLILIGRSRHSSKVVPSVLYWVRRVAVIAFFAGLARFAMLDLFSPLLIDHLLPPLLIEALVAIASSVFSHLLLCSYFRLEKLQKAREAAANAANGADDGDTQYSSTLSFFQTCMVLKPYFWPSFTPGIEANVVLMNRIRSGSTWFFVAAAKVTNLVSPVFLGRATNGVTRALAKGSGQPVPSEVVVDLFIYAFLILVSKTMSECQSLVYIKVQQAAYIEIADNTFGHLHSLSLDWHLRKKMGNVVRSMDRGIAAAQSVMQYICLRLVPTLAEAVAVTLIFIFHFENFRLGVYILLHLVVYVYLTCTITMWRKKFRTASTKSDNKLHERLSDSLVNYETIKYFTAEEYERTEYTRVVTDYQKASMATQASLSFLNIAQQVVVNSALFGGMVIATAHLLDVDGDLGDFVAVNVYIINVFTPLNFLGTIYNMVINSLVDMHSFGQLLAEPNDVKDEPGSSPLDVSLSSSGAPAAPMLEFRGVSFNYRRQVTGRSIRNISFQVQRGGSAAFVGTTGAGKTTITRLLFRFYDVTAGEVRVNGQGIRTVTQRSLRGAIGMVPQDVVMFNDTIAHNIKYGRIGDCTQSDVEKAADNSQLAEFIRQQPSGYNTTVGERGLKLSGGEKQRLAIARCLVKDPAIVVLDEATSALDSHTEKSVQEALMLLSSSRTVLAIAHRLSTIRHCNEILVLEAGQILERGSHDELMQLGESSKYATMWHQQAAGIFDGAPTKKNDAEGDVAVAGGAGLGHGGGHGGDGNAKGHGGGTPAVSAGHGGGHGGGHGHGH